MAPMIEHFVDPLRFVRYIEPFLGGGALFFRLGCAPAILADLNSDLIDTYRQVRDDPISLELSLRALEVNPGTFERMREARPEAPLEIATRFLYLNRTAFSGLYRLNRAGRFNVPYAGDRAMSTLWDRDLLTLASRALQGAKLVVSDFEPTLAEAGRGDIVYCDPTYTVSHDNNGFLRYNESIFSWADQVRLAKAARAASMRGAAILVSNAAHPDLNGLYPEASCLTVRRYCGLAADEKHRGSRTEYVFFIAPAPSDR